MSSEQVNHKDEAPLELNTEEINDHLSARDTLSPETSAEPDVLSPPLPPADPIESIKHMLESKSAAKQTTFRHLAEAFDLMCSDSRRIVQELRSKTQPLDEDVTLDFRIIGKHEFQVKLAGDLLIFVMHTNIITFDDEHEAMKDPYVRASDVNRYFGQINIYNFMYDSLRYNRGNDPGYLIGRLMINHEDRFFMEGEKAFTQPYGRISDGPIDDPTLQDIVKRSLEVAIRNDLMAPPYSRVRSITLNQKNEHSIELGGGQKIGFQMSYQTPHEG